MLIGAGQERSEPDWPWQLQQTRYMREEARDRLQWVLLSRAIRALGRLIRNDKANNVCTIK